MAFLGALRVCTIITSSFIIKIKSSRIKSSSQLQVLSDDPAMDDHCSNLAGREQRLSCSSTSSCEVNNEDEYQDDGLPDLLTGHQDNKSEGSNASSNANSIVDLILSMTGGRRSVSTSDLSTIADASDRPMRIGDAADPKADLQMFEDAYEQVVHAEAKELGFRVSYTDHRKAYVPLKPAYESKVYLSYLCLMPDDNEVVTSKDEDSKSEAPSRLGYDTILSPEKVKFLREERKAVLMQFAKLDGREQELQRRAWLDELKILEDDLEILRWRLDSARKKRNQLKQWIGMARVHQLRANINQVTAGIGNKLMKLGEMTGGTASELERKMERLAKVSIDQIKAAVGRPDLNDKETPKEQT